MPNGNGKCAVQRFHQQHARQYMGQCKVGKPPHALALLFQIVVQAIGATNQQAQGFAAVVPFLKLLSQGFAGVAFPPFIECNDACAIGYGRTNALGFFGENLVHGFARRPVFRFQFFDSQLPVVRKTFLKLINGLLRPWLDFVRQGDDVDFQSEEKNLVVLA